MSDWAPAAVYLLCLTTSVVCAGLLSRAYARSRAKLLLWTAVSFGFLALNNLFLVADMVVFPDAYLTPLRQATSGLALAILLYGFVWETEQ
jgi:K+ transporter